MNMTPRLRKFSLYAHLLFSIGWVGAVLPYLALAVAGLVSSNPQTVRSCYPSMELIGWGIIVPLSIGAMLSGFVQSMGTSWGLFRHWWIVVKLLLTMGATFILWRHMQEVSRVAVLFAEATVPKPELRTLQVQLLVHPSGGLLVLLGIMALSFLKPWGLTPYGKQKWKVPSAPSPLRESARAAEPSATGQSPFWLRVLKIHVIHAIVLGLLFAVYAHLGSGMHHH